jgi:hypothetical protein
VELEPFERGNEMDEFERELRAAIERQPAPPGLKRKVLERRRLRAESLRHRVIWWERLAASVVLAGAVAGAAAWRHAVEQRKGEEAKHQVFTALRITTRALQQMNAQLAERTRDRQ